MVRNSSGQVKHHIHNLYSVFLSCCCETNLVWGYYDMHILLLIMSWRESVWKRLDTCHQMKQNVWPGFVPLWSVVPLFKIDPFAVGVMWEVTTLLMCTAWGERKASENSIWRLQLLSEMNRTKANSIWFAKPSIHTWCFILTATEDGQQSSWSVMVCGSCWFPLSWNTTTVGPVTPPPTPL